MGMKFLQAPRRETWTGVGLPPGCAGGRTAAMAACGPGLEVAMLLFRNSDRQGVCDARTQPVVSERKLNVGPSANANVACS